MNIWQKYVRHIAGDVTGQTIADKTGISQSTASRWLRNVKPPTEAAKVAAFAQGYDRNVLEAFVAAGMLTIDEAQGGLSIDSVETLNRLASGKPTFKVDYVLQVIDEDGERAVVQFTDGRKIEIPLLDDVPPPAREMMTQEENAETLRIRNKGLTKASEPSVSLAPAADEARKGERLPGEGTDDDA